MVIKVKLDGVTFTGDCHKGRLTRGEVRCPNCNNPLQEQVAESGSAYLICLTKNMGCVTPVKSFGNAQGMREWLEGAWESIGEHCKKESSG